MTDDLRAELLRAELALARRDRVATASGLGDLVADDFIEFGASGRLWDAPSIRAALEADPSNDIAIEGFAVACLAADVALATYQTGPPRPVNRSSIWIRRDNRWLIRFHQGTPIPSELPVED